MVAVLVGTEDHTLVPSDERGAVLDIEVCFGNAATTAALGIAGVHSALLSLTRGTALVCHDVYNIAMCKVKRFSHASSDANASIGMECDVGTARVF